MHRVRADSVAFFDMKYKLEVEDWLVACVALATILGFVLALLTCSRTEARVYWRPPGGKRDPGDDNTGRKGAKKGSKKESKQGTRTNWAK